MRVLSKVVVLFCLLPLTLAHSQSPPGNLPVVFESDDARDGLYEAATDALAQLHFAEGVPLAQLTVACGQGSTISPYSCVNGTFHQRYKDWIAQHPAMIEIGHHGLTHAETYATLTRAQQLDLITKGLQEMQTWGLPQGRPFAFAPPFASENSDTISVLTQLGYLTSIRNTDTCLASSMDTFCESVSLCARDASGNRVTGSSCVLLSPSTLISQVNARQGDGKVFLVYHVQDVLLPDLVTVDANKIAALRSIFRAFVAEQTAGHYRLMTFETRRGAPPPPTPTPGTDISVYQDALVSPWIDASWSASVDYANANPVFAGTRSVRVAATGFGALSTHRGNWGAAQEIDPRQYQAVELEIFSSTAGMRLALQLENDSREAFPAVIVGTLPANQWISLSVSLAQLDPGGRLFDRIDLFDYDGTTRTFFVDDLRVVGMPSSTPTPTPTRTSTPLLPTPTLTPAPPTPTSPPSATATPTPPPVATATPTAAPSSTLSPTPTPPPAATATTTPTPAPDLRVYQDSLLSPWINASWSVTVDFANTTPVFEGTRSIKVVETGWGALSAHNGSWTATQPIDPARYQSVSVRVFTTSSGFMPYVRLENDARASFPAVVAGTAPANVWALVTVSMSALDPAGTFFDRLDIGDANGVSRTYFVDDLRIVAR